MPYNLATRLNKLNAKQLLNHVDNFLFDCDGVIWNWPNKIAGSVEAINKLKSMGKRCFFVTNNSTKTRKMLIDMINQVGIQNATEDDIVCTAWVLAGYLKSIDYKDKVYAIGSAAIATELDNLNIKYTGIGCNRHIYPDPAKHNYKTIELDPEVKCKFILTIKKQNLLLIFFNIGVTVGFDYYFNYPKMVEATTYACKVPNCLFIATNDDQVLPTGPESPVVIPGTGTFVNAMRTSVGREPIVLGKPHKTMWDVLAKTHNLDANRSCMIGDRLETDIAFVREFFSLKLNFVSYSFVFVFVFKKAANCSLKYSMAVLSGIASEVEIETYSSKMKVSELNEEQAKYVPDFYVDKLGDLIHLMED